MRSSREHFAAEDTIEYIWHHLGLPPGITKQVDLPGSSTSVFPSSFKISHLAQASIALSALSAALVESELNSTSCRKVHVPIDNVAYEFASERHYRLNDQLATSPWGALGGLHATSDGYVRMHDSFPNHREAACRILGLDSGTATRDDVASRVKQWKALELEKAAMDGKAVIYALRSYQEWDTLPQAQAVPDVPVTIRKISNNGPKGFPEHMPIKADRCLRGLRVIELSRVIAAPVAGKTLAAHGADVLWVTSPNLPSLPDLDIDVSRGKRSIQLDIQKPEDAAKLRELVKSADVFLQSYRPGSLGAKGFGAEDLAKLHPGIIYANLSAWGNEGPWAQNRGFDSIVQTVSGMNVSEAEHFGTSPAKPMPVQALDHAAGYLLATGISAAVYRRAIEGGSWEVNVSLAGVMQYLRSLGQYPGKIGFENKPSTDVEEYLEERESGFGRLEAVRHSAGVEGKQPGWDVMPDKLGSGEARWL